MSVLVAISQVENGSQHSTKPELLSKIKDNRREWFMSLDLSTDNATRVVTSYDRSDYCVYREVSLAKDRGLGMYIPVSEPSDALITRDKGHILFLPVADCMAATLYDPITETLMLSHLGRHSLEQDGAYKSVKHLVDNYEVDAKNLQIWLSPAPSKETYPIYALSGVGMKEAAMSQLTRAGVGASQITDSPYDTATDDRYYSHSAFRRGEKPTDGRYAMLAVLG